MRYILSIALLLSAQAFAGIGVGGWGLIGPGHLGQQGLLNALPETNLEKLTVDDDAFRRAKIRLSVSPLSLIPVKNGEVIESIVVKNADNGAIVTADGEQQIIPISAAK